MTTIGSFDARLVDVLNPSIGYQVRVEDDRGGVLIFTSKDPVTSRDLLTPEDCLRVVSYYLRTL